MTTSQVQYVQFDNEDEAREFVQRYWDDPDYSAILTETDKGWQVILKYYPEDDNA